MTILINRVPFTSAQGSVQSRRVRNFEMFVSKSHQKQAPPFLLRRRNNVVMLKCPI